MSEKAYKFGCILTAAGSADPQDLWLRQICIPPWLPART